MRRHSGLGLGLAIARELVELHNGTIRVESLGRDQGSTFTVELPIADALNDRPLVDRSTCSTPVEWRFVPSPLLKGVRALIVEDDAATREVIQYLLERCEAEVTAIDKGAAALDVFTDHLKEDRFDVLLSDIGLPEMSGLELMRRIRMIERRAGDTPPVPAVALTAYARDLDRDEALAAGFDTHLIKPVVAATLIAAVAECVGRSGELKKEWPTGISNGGDS